MSFNTAPVQFFWAGRAIKVQKPGEEMVPGFWLSDDLVLVP